MRTTSEEDYLRAIYDLWKDNGDSISTTDIANFLNMKASSVTDMIQKLSEKGLVDYIKYKGVKLTSEGKSIAIGIIRKHRLWETFLVNKLNFKWDEVHELAHELEHIQSDVLIDRLDDFLGNPKFDPHGDPIPDRFGNINDNRMSQPLVELEAGQCGIIVGVNDTSSALLKYLDKEGMILGTTLEVMEVLEFDNSRKIKYEKGEKNISELVAKNVMVQIQ